MTGHKSRALYELLSIIVYESDIWSMFCHNREAFIILYCRQFRREGSSSRSLCMNGRGKSLTYYRHTQRCTKKHKDHSGNRSQIQLDIYNTEQNSWIMPHFFIIWCQRARLSGHFLNWSWATILQASSSVWRPFNPFFFLHCVLSDSFSVQFLTWPFSEELSYCLLSHLKLTYESLEHKI